MKFKEKMGLLLLFFASVVANKLITLMDYILLFLSFSVGGFLFMLSGNDYTPKQSKEKKQEIVYLSDMAIMNENLRKTRGY